MQCDKKVNKQLNECAVGKSFKIMHYYGKI